MFAAAAGGGVVLVRDLSCAVSNPNSFATASLARAAPVCGRFRRSGAVDAFDGFSGGGRGAAYSESARWELRGGGCECRFCWVLRAGFGVRARSRTSGLLSTMRSGSGSTPVTTQTVPAVRLETQRAITAARLEARLPPEVARWTPVARSEPLKRLRMFRR